MKWRIERDQLDKRILIKCLECKKEFLIRAYKPTVGRGKFCSRACFAIWMSKNLVGEKANGWKGGLTPLYRSIRTIKKYYKYRNMALERDNYRCILCGSMEKLEVDHIVTLLKIVQKYNIQTTQDAKNCPELWDINNLRTLCHNCHIKTDTYALHSSTNFIQKE